MRAALRAKLCASLALIVLAHAAAAQGIAPDQVAAKLAAIAAGVPDASGERAAIERYGTSGEGRPLEVLRLGDGAPTTPALLIVAGLDGRLHTGVDVALGVAEAFAGPHAAALERATLYVVACANPDARARHAAGGAVADFGGVLEPFDDDHDGRVDEDGAADVNGDGVVTMMRVANPPPGIERTHIADPDEPRLMRTPERARGERPAFALLVEGRDDDGDGRFAEDGTGGADLDRNFPHQWPELGEHAGATPLSRPESRALVDWMLAHPEIAAVVVFGAHDNLVDVPEAGKTDATKEAPLGLESDDRPYHEEIARTFGELTGAKHGAKQDPAGSFVAWSYAQFGVPSFAAALAVAPQKPPDAPAPPAPPAPPEGAAANDATPPPESPDAPPEPPPPAEAKPAKTDGERKRPDAEALLVEWIAESDRRGSGFVPWTRFEHPQLGPVEIGGFVPGFRGNAPPDAVARLVDEQRRFAAHVIERVPRLSAPRMSVERLGGDAARPLFRVRVSVSNEGTLPTVSAIGRKLRRVLPVSFRLESPAAAGDADATLVAGEPLQRSESLQGGAEAAAEWLLTAPPGTVARVTLLAGAPAPRVLEIPLVETER